VSVANRERVWRVSEIVAQVPPLYHASSAKKRGAQKYERVLLHTLVFSFQVCLNNLAANNNAAISKPILERRIYFPEGLDWWHFALQCSKGYCRRQPVPSRFRNWRQSATPVSQ
jgi:hypothetical protein